RPCRVIRAVGHIGKGARFAAWFGYPHQINLWFFSTRGRERQCLAIGTPARLGVLTAAGNLDRIAPLSRSEPQVARVTVLQLIPFDFYIRNPTTIRADARVF